MSSESLFDRELRLAAKARRLDPILHSMFVIRSAAIKGGQQELAIACGWSAMRMWQEHLTRDEGI